MTRIRLGLLGGFEISGTDGEPLSIGMRKAKALLAWLALRPGEPQSRERLAGLLWAESGEAAARHSLRQALSVLRRALPDPDGLLSTGSETVGLVPGALDTDVARFCTLARSRDTRDLEAAADLYRGELLEGFSARAPEFEDWMLTERSRLRELACGVLTGLLERHKTARDWEKALRSALRLLAMEPLRESVQREAMALEMRLGRPAEALRRYRACEAKLLRDLGVAPEAETRELYRRILAERRQGASGAEQPAAAPSARASVSSPDGVTPPHADADLVGRDAELRQVAGALDACLEAGVGSALLVRGEAGIGKSALADATVRLAQTRRCRIHRIALFEPGTDAPSASAAVLIRELLDLTADAAGPGIRRAVEAACGDLQDSISLLDALGVPLDPAEGRFLAAFDLAERRAALNRALGTLLELAARQRPRMLLVEDIHWADAGFSRLLAGLVAAANPVPVFLLLTSRQGGEALDPAWRAAMQGTPLTTLDLGPLRPEAAGILARRAGAEDDPDWVDRCVARAAGNPLFLEHLVRAGPELGTAVPASVQELVERRLSGLSAEDRRIAQTASVLGQRFSGATLDALLGGAPDPCGALCSAGLLRRDGDWYQFDHVLVREGIYGSLSTPARNKLHRKAADWYRGREAALYADHLALAGDPAAADASLDAARECLAGHRYDKALDMANRARRLAEGAAGYAQAGLFLASLHRDRGEIPAARRLLETVIAETADGQLLCDARIDLADALLVQDAYDEALAQLAAAEPLAETLGGDERLARLQYHRGNACFSLGRLAECMSAHGEALSHARAACDPELEARALSGLADAHYQRGRMVTANHYYDRCVRLSQARGLLRVEAANLAGRSMTAVYLNRLGDALDDAAAAVRSASLTRSRRDECLARHVLAIAALQAGEWDRAERESEEGIAIARDVGLRRFEADHLSMRGSSRAESGRVSEGRADLESAWALVRDRDMAYGGPWVLGFLARYEADPSLRRDYLERGEIALAQDSVSHNHFQFRQCALEIALEEGDRVALEHHASALAAYTVDEPLPWSELRIASTEALLDWKEGGREEALMRRLSSLEGEARAAGLLALADTLSAALQAAS